MNQHQIEYCLNMLPRVSRTFAPTIRMLPKALNVPVTVAYLLCRIADTVEDSSALSIDQKEELLQIYIAIFEAEKPEDTIKVFLEKLKVLPRETNDEELSHNLPVVMDVFFSFSPILQKQIAFWVIEMSRGMRKYAQSSYKRRFAFLKSMKELDEYTYYVAGTVGYLLTEIFSFYSKKITPAIKDKLEHLAESFGKGLQMVNIIRDMATDLRRGQSYIPDELLKKYRLSRRNIFEQENAARAEQLFNEMICKAIEHLDRALDYILLIPKEETRIRLFCMLPLFWAMRTLQKIQENTLALLGSEKIKVSRSMIKREYYLALINMNSNRLMRRHYLNIRNSFSPYALAQAS
ncbi:MAG: squalene/phytoene synthase family protein [Calditrichaceae bacterium]|nr:squalene/phytoene synthase family protein [Calditrichaceae bacterium]MBN2707822.1 squalene/phytoene synthase family protein [Calditrichaceae bacterium]RQV94889.1 MAG: squalene/phytoene synthase family protein [Calditrichota bacterium]